MGTKPLEVHVTPHSAGQWTVMEALRNANNREVYVRKGRRWGGSWTAAAVATEFATQNPMSPSGNNKPTEIAFFGPLYENAKRLWKEIVDSFGPALQSYRESDLSLVWIGGARGKCFSGEKSEAALGAGFDIVILDEASNFPHEVVRSIITPTLADRSGRLWVISSPRHGKLNWFAQRCVKAEAGEISGVVGFHFPTSSNGRLKPETLSAWRNDPDMDDRTWDEEFEALILDASSAWLDPSLIKRIKGDLIPANTFNVLTSDFAWGSPDAGMVDKTTLARKDANVLAVVSQDALGNVYLRKDGVYEKYLEPDDAFDHAARLIRDYDIRRFAVEREVNISNTTDDMFGRLWKAYMEKNRVPLVSMIRPRRAAKWKIPAIRRWSVLLSRGKFFIEDGAVLDAPLCDEMFKFTETAAMNNKCHDDALVAVADVMLPGIWQGEKVERDLHDNPGKDIFFLREAYERVSRGGWDNAADPRLSRYGPI